NGLGPQNAAATNSGLRDTYGYTISPDLYFRFGQFARSETTLTQSSVFFSEPGGTVINQPVPGALSIPDEVISYGATERISSGPDFYRFNWIVTGSANETTQSGLDYTSLFGTANVRYAITYGLILDTMFGYESFSSNQTLSSEVTGTIAQGGLQYRPNNIFS